MSYATTARELLERIVRVLWTKYGVVVRPYQDPQLTYFQTLPIHRKTAIIENLKLTCQIYEDSGEHTKGKRPLHPDCRG
jgi:hypothetical protein